MSKSVNVRQQTSKEYLNLHEERWLFNRPTCLSSSPWFESGPSRDQSANPVDSCAGTHLEWHTFAGWSLRGGRDRKKNMKTQKRKKRLQ
jgi:hypothetical protein